MWRATLIVIMPPQANGIVGAKGGGQGEQLFALLNEYLNLKTGYEAHRKSTVFVGFFILALFASLHITNDVTF